MRCPVSRATCCSQRCVPDTCDRRLIFLSLDRSDRSTGQGRGHGRSLNVTLLGVVHLAVRSTRGSLRTLSNELGYALGARALTPTQFDRVQGRRGCFAASSLSFFVFYVEIDSLICLRTRRADERSTGITNKHNNSSSSSSKSNNKNNYNNKLRASRAYNYHTHLFLCVAMPVGSAPPPLNGPLATRCRHCPSSSSLSLFNMIDNIQAQSSRRP